jgi:hypothetical protein
MVTSSGHKNHKKDEAKNHNVLHRMQKEDICEKYVGKITLKTTQV